MVKKKDQTKTKEDGVTIATRDITLVRNDSPANLSHEASHIISIQCIRPMCRQLNVA